ncbi:MarR family transcriptional regulator [Proteiniclasticum sp. SCR006]|uniref:MarR family transcriptional regulator n=1 Tax=Proteiniclasticum aestuarii TaxID=2817862 RepID=A0A939KJE3_9CLOT|nr:MarR family transcriptional regulator [Proteiniclasticum aestuarii]MBO1264961.1 MarR family transcriptional regulator [Proteiniclasticum aestuarii]
MGKREKMQDAGENILGMTILMHSKFVNFHTISKTCEVPQSYVRVLFILKKFREMTMSEMAKIMVISKPNLTPVIDRLILDGYVERKPGPKDRRKLVISLTDAGRAYLEEVEQKVKGHTADKLESLSEEDLTDLKNASQKIIEIIRKLK